MKIFNNINFAKQLIIYLLVVLIITFLFISLALTNSVNQFIGNNAYSQAQSFANNVHHIFKREILKIESIPDNLTSLHEYYSLLHSDGLPIILLKNYPQLISCSIYYGITDPSTQEKEHIIARRFPDGSIQLVNTEKSNEFPLTKTHTIVRQNKHGSFWMYSSVGTVKTMAFYFPLTNYLSHRKGILKLDFPLKTITDIICNNHIYKYENLFILDSLGNYLVTPFQEVQPNQYISKVFTNINEHKIRNKIARGETGYSTYYSRNTKYFVYYSPLPCMNWRLGIICPYNEVLNSSHKLYWVLFLCLGGGLLFLFIGIINIVHRLSYPLIQLAESARQIADGHFNVRIPQLKSSHEINELYASFRYMQHSIINYIEKLKVSTAEKEQLNSEMNLARRIQQRFLPHHIQLPAHVKLAAELRQCRDVGGDFYDFFILSGRLYFIIGDVSGKGIPAALYVASISKLFRYVANNHSSTAKICNIINRHMCEDAEDDMYVTLFMGILDVNTGNITYTNAGHPYPLVIHENGQTNFLNQYPDVPIGVLEEHYFTEHSYTLQKGMSLLFYTDGITDTENPDGQFYGKEKLVKCIKKTHQQLPEDILHTILEDIRKHMAIRNQSDDLTLLMICYKCQWINAVETSCK